MDQAVEHPSRRHTGGPAPPASADVGALVSSIAFWAFSTIAVALCAAVEILPRLEQCRGLALQAGRLTHEIDTLSQANDRLSREVEALDRDPFYVEEVARRQLGFHRPDERRLRVGTLYVPAPPRRALPPEPWPRLQRLQRLFAHDQSTRRAGLATAAVLILCAFLFFHGTRPQPVVVREQPAPPPVSAAIPDDDDVIYPPVQRLAG